MKTAREPLLIERAKDCTLYGKEGKTYIDAISSWWVNIHGHANEKISASIAEQAEKLEQVIFAGFTHEPAETLAEKLLQIAPGNFSKVFYSDDGSTSVEVAVKMALQFWHNQGATRKTMILAFEDGYHGDTFGAMSVGAPSVFNSAFSKHLFPVHHIPVPSADNLAHIFETIRTLNIMGEIAAFIFEPLVQGAGGMKMHQPEDLKKLLQFVREEGIICIADEVMTGFGRTGRNFAMEWTGVQPDIICLSKGITGGFLPLGVTLCTQAVFDAFYSDDKYKTLYHGHSYTANPLACAAANSSLDILLSEGCRQSIQRICTRHKEFGKSLGSSYIEPIKDLRQRGTILAIEFQNGKDSSYFDPLRDRLYDFFLENGVLLRPLGNTVYIMPPYCIRDEELEKVYEVITEAIEKIIL